MKVTAEVVALVTAGLALIGQAITHFVGRRQRGADVTSTIVGGASELSEAIRAELADMRQTLKGTRAELDEVQARRRTLEAHVAKQDAQMEILTDSVVMQRRELERQRQILAQVLASGRAWMSEHTQRLEALGATAEPWPREFVEGVSGVEPDPS